MINPGDIKIFTSQSITNKKTQKEFTFLLDEDTRHNKALVLICTYSMLAR